MARRTSLKRANARALKRTRRPAPGSGAVMACVVIVVFGPTSPYMSMANKPSAVVTSSLSHPRRPKRSSRSGMHTVLPADATPLKPNFPSAEKVMSSPPETADGAHLSKKTANSISVFEGQLKTKPGLPDEEKNIVIEVIVLPVSFWKLSSTQKADWKGHGFAAEFAAAVAVTVGLGSSSVIRVASVPFWGMGFGSDWAQAEAEKRATASSKTAGRKCFTRSPVHARKPADASGAIVAPKSPFLMRFNPFVMLG